MTQYAAYDSTVSAPSPVIGWYDTAALTYITLPSNDNLLVLTADQWNDRINGFWAVDNGELVAYTPPTPVLTLAQQAQKALKQGLAVTSSAWPNFSGTYAVDPTSQGKIGSVSTYILVNSKFPGGVTQYPWLDISNTPHLCPTTLTFQQFATAVADYVAALDVIMATNEGSLPAPTATIN